MTAPGGPTDPPWYSVPYGESGGVGQPGYVSPPTPVTLGSIGQIAYPVTTPDRTVPTTLHWAVILNASPFTIVISSGRDITQIAAFTADAVQVVLTQNQPLTIIPVAGLGLIQTGTDSTVYATWYEDRPLGTYPSAIGAGTTPTNQSSLLLTQTVTTPPGGPQSFVVSKVQPWMQALAIRYLDQGGTVTGLRVTVTSGLDVLGVAVIGFSQWFFVPIQGGKANISVTLEPILAGVAGGNMLGELSVWGMAGPVLNQRLGAIPNVGQQAGLRASAAIAAAGNTTMIPRPNSGTMIYVRSVSYTQQVAPAAAALLTVRGSVGLNGYYSWVPPAAVSANDIGGAGFYLGDSGQLDPAEGLNVLNGTTQAATVRVGYDVVPTPFGSGEA